MCFYCNLEGYEYKAIHIGVATQGRIHANKQITTLVKHYPSLLYIELFQKCQKTCAGVAHNEMLCFPFSLSSLESDPIFINSKIYLQLHYFLGSIFHQKTKVKKTHKSLNPHSHGIV